MQKPSHKYYMPEEEGKPAKKKVTKKKPVVDLSEQASLTPEIADLIRNAVDRFSVAAESSQNIRQSKLVDLEHLDKIVEEYLSAYLILGYDINGEKVTISHARNPQDRDSLIEHLRTTLFNTMNNG